MMAMCDMDCLNCKYPDCINKRIYPKSNHPEPPKEQPRGTRFICKTVDDIRKALWDITDMHRGKRDYNITTRCELAGICHTTLYRFMDGTHNIRINFLVSVLNAMGYRMVIVKVGDDDDEEKQLSQG